MVIGRHSVGQQEHAFVQLLLAFPFHLELPVPGALGKINHLLQVASGLVHLSHSHTHSPYLLAMRFPSIQVFEDIEALQVVVDFLLRRER